MSQFSRLMKTSRKVLDGMPHTHSKCRVHTCVNAVGYSSSKRRHGTHECVLHNLSQMASEISRRKLFVVARQTSSKDSARNSASLRAVCTTKAGSLRLPRFGTGAR
jgi:hypothetical protein